MLEARSLSYRYPGAEGFALEDVSFALPAGEGLLVAGESGGGKSTLLALLAGLHLRFLKGEKRGEVLLDSEPCSSFADWAARTGLMTQNPETQFLAGSVEDELYLTLRCRGISGERASGTVEERLAAFGIARVRDSSVFRLSEGQKQKVVLASLTALRPRALFLDEPSANLDPASLDELAGLLKTVRDGGVSLVVADHRLYWLKGVCSRVLVLSRGKPAASGDWGILSDPCLRDRLGLRSSERPAQGRLSVAFAPRPEGQRPKDGRREKGPHAAGPPEEGGNGGAASSSGSREAGRGEAGGPGADFGLAAGKDVGGQASSLGTFGSDAAGPASGTRNVGGALSSEAVWASGDAEDAGYAEVSGAAGHARASGAAGYAKASGASGADGNAKASGVVGNFMASGDAEADGAFEASGDAEVAGTVGCAWASGGYRASGGDCNEPMKAPASSRTGQGGVRGSGSLGGVEIEDLTFRYPGGPLILDGFSGRLPAGKVAALAGPSGRGKTTLARLLCGLEKPLSGRILYGGEPARAGLGQVVLQNSDHQLYMPSALEEVTVALGGKRKLAMPRAMEMLESFGLGRLASRHPQSLSGGEKQRLVVAVGLARPTRLVVLDEPTSGLDGRNLRLMARQIRAVAESGPAVLVITHDEELVGLAADFALDLGPPPASSGVEIYKDVN
ncbi:MAG: ATP-binding cassette domain-containing protein [Deltaproteobacteria bacterium]|jgi:energy-coupling factor transporter ATP-binding protein EcfA2|nr:ATP-binding cassette domain-containing protein [Deltaproteobacteria bacterium]